MTDTPMKNSLMVVFQTTSGDFEQILYWDAEAFPRGNAFSVLAYADQRVFNPVSSHAELVEIGQEMQQSVDDHRASIVQFNLHLWEIAQKLKKEDEE